MVQVVAVADEVLVVGNGQSLVGPALCFGGAVCWRGRGKIGDEVEIQ